MRHHRKIRIGLQNIESFAEMKMHTIQWDEHKRSPMFISSLLISIGRSWMSEILKKTVSECLHKRIQAPAYRCAVNMYVTDVGDCIRIIVIPFKMKSRITKVDADNSLNYYGSLLKGLSYCGQFYILSESTKTKGTSKHNLCQQAHWLGSIICAI